MPSLDFLLIGLTLALGFAMVRANLCLVAGVREGLLHRRWKGMAGLALASSASGVVLLAAYLVLPAQVMLPVDSDAWWDIILGSVLLGLGSLLNGGCYLGSITYIGRGNVHYLFTLLGIGMSLRWADRLPSWATLMKPGSQMTLTAAAIAAVAAFALVLGLGIRTIVRAKRSEPMAFRRGPWPWPVAAMTCGVLAGAVFTRHPNWNYGSVIDYIAHADTRPLNYYATASVLALFAGAATSALLMHRFQWPTFSILKALRCLLGGALMGYGAARIPGGNDTLLLWSIPGLAVYGLVAFTTMALTIAAAVAAEQRLQARRVAS